MKTYWNGEPCKARRVIVIVAPAEKSTFWYAHLAGKERQAVEVVYGNQTFYLDNAADLGWAKVTTGKGSPRWGHRSLSIERVVRAVDWRESGPELERERDRLDDYYDGTKDLTRDEMLAEIAELAERSCSDCSSRRLCFVSPIGGDGLMTDKGLQFAQIDLCLDEMGITDDYGTVAERFLVLRDRYCNLKNRKAPGAFRSELIALINKHSMENGSGTPDFILAQFLEDQIEIFDNAVSSRELWYSKVEEKQAVPVIITQNGTCTFRFSESDCDHQYAGMIDGKFRCVGCGKVLVND